MVQTAQEKRTLSTSMGYRGQGCVATLADRNGDAWARSILEPMRPRTATPDVSFRRHRQNGTTQNITSFCVQLLRQRAGFIPSDAGSKAEKQTINLFFGQYARPPFGEFDIQMRGTAFAVFDRVRSRSVGVQSMTWQFSPLEFALSSRSGYLVTRAMPLPRVAKIKNCALAHFGPENRQVLREGVPPSGSGSRSRT